MRRFNWISFAALIVASGCDPESGGSPDPAEQFAGAWNYDLPDLETGRNVATLSCPGPEGNLVPRLTLPQLGSLTLRPTGSGRLEGTTDQGCSWGFEVDGPTAELSPPGQSCHNAVFDLDYTIVRWTLTREGDIGHERVEAISHNPGEECSFQLADGLRSRVAEEDDDAAARFAGRWNHGEPAPESGINLAQVICPSVGGAPSVLYQPVAGALEVTRTSADTARATDGQGCAWTFDVRGGTAWLSPVPQRCEQPDATITALSFWSFAVAADHGFEIMSGVRTSEDETCAYVVPAGELRREVAGSRHPLEVGR